ncbi:ATP-binding cassette domain-containing protein [Synechococcus sp. HJ21-Hayes]|uniref:phosphonate ABC transporter ATP-binding protein n=1 Tax=unclassified Synechococcus TaxID=2626047 RepID=UPI0020CEDA00|nr:MULTISPECIES: ATP-binding cassette domain-containing protein [unclassified Synechococcus]MCP9831625.1 ATP-binding cassette domain-containing protein [Synechococcus sp. JJ3a-Johnson]MCP9852581.1 ATP-binding cassette domain-containing protein [Synechococcus sp. HJ21-Hayes]
MQVPSPNTTPPVLALEAITVKGRGRPRLDGVTLQIAAGERVALLGPSGAGKSTLLAVANGLLTPSGGQVLWDQQPRAHSARGRLRQQARIGTLWQDLRLIDELTVQQNLNAGCLARWGWPRAVLNLLLPIDSAACAEALQRMDLDPELLNQSVAALSGGQRQRVAMARMLRQEPTLLLADEPLANLDPRLAADLLELLLEQAGAPRALLLSLHRPDLLQGFDRAIGLRNGQIQFDQPVSEIGPEQIQRLYGAEATSP